MHGRHDQLHAAVSGANHIGHNHSRDEAVQWQTPHTHHHHHHDDETPVCDEYRDMDLVERAFIQGFTSAPDPTSFLRLAGVPFCGRRGDGTTLRLLRVEQAQSTDIGSVTPHLGGGTFRYDPLPAKLVSRRDRLNFIYFDGEQAVDLNLADARALEPLSASDDAAGN